MFSHGGSCCHLLRPSQLSFHHAEARRSPFDCLTFCRSRFPSPSSLLGGLVVTKRFSKVPRFFAFAHSSMVSGIMNFLLTGKDFLLLPQKEKPEQAVPYIIIFAVYATWA